MATQTIGNHIVLVDNEIEARITPVTPAKADSQGYNEGTGYFAHPNMVHPNSLAEMDAAVAPHKVPFPTAVAGNVRLFGLHYLRDPQQELSDMAVTFIESGVHEQPLASGSRPLIPADYSVAVFWTRRIGTPVIYAAQRTTRVNSEAGIIQDPHAESRVGPWPAIRMRWEAVAGAESLRARRAPAEFVIWYDEGAEAWISVRSRDPQISAIEVGGSLYS